MADIASIFGSSIEKLTNTAIAAQEQLPGTRPQTTNQTPELPPFSLSTHPTKHPIQVVIELDGTAFSLQRGILYSSEGIK